MSKVDVGLLMTIWPAQASFFVAASPCVTHEHPLVLHSLFPSKRPSRALRQEGITVLLGISPLAASLMLSMFAHSVFVNCVRAISNFSLPSVAVGTRLPLHI